MSNTQLKIRIRLDQPIDHSAAEQDLLKLAEEPVLPAPPLVYVYNWPRIIGASLVLLLVLAVLFWLASDWISGDKESGVNPAEISSSAALPANPDIPPVPAAQSVSAITELSPSQSSESNPGADELAGIHTEPEHIEDIPSPIFDSISAATSDPPIKPGTKPGATAFQSSESGAQKINYPVGLVKAQLTSNIRQRAPVDDINRISLAGKSSRPIFLFLHFNKFKGGKIFINWYYRDKRVAKVMLPVSSNDWRTYSSKVLNQNRLGSWRVTATDQSGKWLAEFKFRVTR